MARETLSALRKWGAGVLREADIDGADLDARLLLQHATGLAHEDLVADPAALVEDALFRTLINRRATNEPVSRIIGRREFYGRDFIVTPDTLDPRADTETVIEEALSLFESSPSSGEVPSSCEAEGDFRLSETTQVPLRLAKARHLPRKGGGLAAPCLLDLGTGTGAIAVTLLAERPHWTGTATDISSAALAVAHANAARHGVDGRLAFVHGSWFDGVAGRFDLILSNPPYIPLWEIATLDRDVKDFDPHRALDGGPDGLEAYRRIARGAAAHLKDGGRVVLEIGAGQAADVARIFESAGFSGLGNRKDLGGHVRALTFGLPPL
jgi:release factor glutamine methyltransferase